MTNELFLPYSESISDAIAKADTKEKQLACNFMIEHLENDYSYKHFNGKVEKIQELRDQLQAKHEELLAGVYEFNADNVIISHPLELNKSL